MTANTILALDFGGTKLACGILDGHRRRWVLRDKCPTPSGRDATAVLERMLSLADALIEEARVAPAVVGISFNGPVDHNAGCPRTCYHIAGWERYPLQQRISDHYGAPAVLENDATAAAMGEWQYGAGRGCQDIAYLTISTGVGSGLVLNGEPYRGRDGLAGEIGHLCLDADGPLCSCGQRGCLEAIAAGPAIVRHFGELSARQSTVETAEEGRQRITAEDVSLAAQEGNTQAQEALAISARAVGLAIGNLLNLLNLDRVIIGGGVTRAGIRYLSTVRQSARARAIAGVLVDILSAELGEEAPLWGVSALAEEHLQASQQVCPLGRCSGQRDPEPHSSGKMGNFSPSTGVG